MFKLPTLFKRNEKNEKESIIYGKHRRTLK